MADLVTMIRRALGLEHQLPEVPQETHVDEHDRIDRRLQRHDVRLRALDERIKAQTAAKK